MLPDTGSRSRPAERAARRLMVHLRAPAGELSQVPGVLPSLPPLKALRRERKPRAPRTNGAAGVKSPAFPSARKRPRACPERTAHARALTREGPCRGRTTRRATDRSLSAPPGPSAPPAHDKAPPRPGPAVTPAAAAPLKTTARHAAATAAACHPPSLISPRRRCPVRLYREQKPRSAASGQPGGSSAPQPLGTSGSAGTGSSSAGATARGEGLTVPVL